MLRFVVTKFGDIGTTEADRLGDIRCRRWLTAGGSFFLDVAQSYRIAYIESMARSPSSRDAVPGLAQTLRQLRHDANLTLVALAAKAGTTAAAISDIERGERSPSFGLICRLADALGVSVADFRPIPRNNAH
jgi:DNA-binding XRE family transcriptional regulator